MAVFLFVLFVALPLAELAVIIKAGQSFGVLPTLVALVLISVAGAALARREGVAAWRRFREAIARGEAPASEIADGFLILLAAALLMTPGFITDAFGLVLLAPPSRAAVKRGLRKGGGWLAFRRFRYFRA